MCFPSHLVRSISFNDEPEYLDPFEFESSDEEEEYDGRSNCSEILAGEEAEANALQNEFRLEKLTAYTDYRQIMQLTIEFIKSKLTPSGNGVINIEKSTEAGEIYIYMPITANIYTLTHDPTRTLKSLLYYIIHITPEFLDYVNGQEFNFALDSYKFVNDSNYFCEPQNNDISMSADDLLNMPLDEIHIMQGTITLK